MNVSFLRDSDSLAFKRLVIVSLEPSGRLLRFVLANSVVEILRRPHEVSEPAAILERASTGVRPHHFSDGSIPIKTASTGPERLTTIIASMLKNAQRAGFS